MRNNYIWEILKILKDVGSYTTNQGKYYNELNNFFENYQKVLVWFFNSWLGRKYVGINPPGRIVKVSPNAFHYQISENEFVMEARCYPLLAKKLYYILARVPALVLATLIAPATQIAFALTVDTFYSGAGDGIVYHEGTSGESWGTVRNASDAAGGGSFVDYSTTNDAQILQVWCTSANIYAIRRSFFPFNTAGLSDSAVISGVVFSVFYAKSTTSNDSITVVQASQASNTQLVSTDYDNIGSTKGSDDETNISSITDNAYHNYTLNATGRGWISLTGYTLLGLRLGYDLYNNTPGNNTNRRMGGYFSEYAGTDHDPKLAITYTLPGPANLKTINGLAEASIKTVNGLAIASVKSRNGLT